MGFWFVLTFRLVPQRSQLLSIDFTQRCLAMPESSGAPSFTMLPCIPLISAEFVQRYPSTRKSDAIAALKPSPLLNEWAKARLVMDGSWTDALAATAGVGIVLCSRMSPGPDIVGFELAAPKFTVYRSICECLETIDRILDASKCFLQMVDELAGETTTHRAQVEWAAGERLCIPC